MKGTFALSRTSLAHLQRTLLVDCPARTIGPAVEASCSIVDFLRHYSTVGSTAAYIPEDSPVGTNSNPGRSRTGTVAGYYQQKQHRQTLTDRDLGKIFLSFIFTFQLIVY